MSDFLGISKPETWGEETTPETTPVIEETTTPPQEKEVTQATTVSAVQSPGNSSFFDKIGVDRQAVAEPPTQTTEKAEEKETEEEAAPEEAQDKQLHKVGLTPQMQKTIGTMMAEGCDYLFPKGISMLYGEDDHTKYKADPEPKEITADGFRRWLAEKDANVTPGQQILMGLAMGYGIPLGMAGFERIVKYFDEKKAHKENNTNPQFIAQQQELQILRDQLAASNNEDGATPAQPPTPPAKEATPQQEPETSEIKPGDKVHECAECKKLIKDGYGYPKNKKSKNYDKTCNASCLGKYTGRQNTKKKK